MSAYSELMEYLDDGEVIEGIVFGEWGWGGFDESEHPSVPLDKRGVVMSLSEAEPMMQSWDFDGGFGAPECYAVNIWTNKRVIWVHEYDGATGLASAMRNPTNYMPILSGN